METNKTMLTTTPTIQDLVGQTAALYLRSRDGWGPAPIGEVYRSRDTGERVTVLCGFTAETFGGCTTQLVAYRGADGRIGAAHLVRAGRIERFPEGVDGGLVDFEDRAAPTELRCLDIEAKVVRAAQRAARRQNPTTTD
jgi:hypothetical protein